MGNLISHTDTARSLREHSDDLMRIIREMQDYSRYGNACSGLSARHVDGFGDRLFDVAFALDRLARQVENQRNQLAMF